MDDDWQPIEKAPHKRLLLGDERTEEVFIGEVGKGPMQWPPHRGRRGTPTHWKKLPTISKKKK